MREIRDMSDKEREGLDRYIKSELKIHQGESFYLKRRQVCTKTSDDTCVGKVCAKCGKIGSHDNILIYCLPYQKWYCIEHQDEIENAYRESQIVIVPDEEIINGEHIDDIELKCRMEHPNE